MAVTFNRVTVYSVDICSYTSMTSPESQALTKCYPTLVTCIQRSPGTVSTELKPYGLLAPQDFQYISNHYHNDDDKARRILDSVCNQVLIDPNAFHTFLKAFKKAGAFTKSAVDELVKSYTGEDVLKAPDISDSNLDMAEQRLRADDVSESNIEMAGQRLRDRLPPNINSSSTEPLHSDTPSPTYTTQSHKEQYHKPDRNPTIAVLKSQTGVTDAQLDKELVNSDIQILAGCFSNYKAYVDQLELDPSKQADLSRVEYTENHQGAMREALKLWKDSDPKSATYRALVSIALKLGKGEDARNVCVHVAEVKTR